MKAIFIQVSDAFEASGEQYDRIQAKVEECLQSGKPLVVVHPEGLKVSVVLDPGERLVTVPVMEDEFDDEEEEDEYPENKPAVHESAICCGCRQPIMPDQMMKAWEDSGVTTYTHDECSPELKRGREFI